MTPPTKVNLTIYQGATFKWPFYWYSDVEVPVVITAVARTYPTIITAAGHALPDSAVPAAILNVGDWLDTASTAPSDRVYVTKIDTDNCSVKINGAGQPAYSGTAGRLVYNAPMDLTTWTGRLQIRASIDDDTVIEEFTTEDGRMSLGADGLIQLLLSDTDTDALSFDPSVYDLEVVNPGNGEVTRLAYGTVTLSPQVTRTP